MSETGALGSLFLAAFLSATLLPGGSELLLALLLQEGRHAPWALWAAATVGNVLGSLVTFAMGWGIAQRWGRRLQEDPRHRQAVVRLRRWGVWALLLAWLPVVGDPLCFAAGWLRLPWLPALAMIALGKGGRYALLVWGVEWLRP